MATLLIYYKPFDSDIYVSINSFFALTEKLNIPCSVTPDVYNNIIKLQNNELHNSQSFQIVDNHKSKNNPCNGTSQAAESIVNNLSVDN